jgi:hypothetical protein
VNRTLTLVDKTWIKITEGGTVRTTLVIRVHTDPRRQVGVIILGIVCLILGFLLGISILWTIGIILVVIGVVLALVGATGHAIGGRRHWY